MSKFMREGYIYDTGLLNSGTNRLKYDLSNRIIKLLIVQTVNYPTKCTASVIPKGAGLNTAEARGCLICQESLVPAHSCQWQGYTKLNADEELRVSFYNATAGDRYYVVIRFEH